jgi:hypothetical protein
MLPSAATRRSKGKKWLRDRQTTELRGLARSGIRARANM